MHIEDSRNASDFKQDWIQVVKQCHQESFSISYLCFTLDYLHSQVSDGYSETQQHKLVNPAKKKKPKKSGFFPPIVPAKLQDLLQLAHLGDWLTSGPISIAKEIGSSNWSAPVLPLELGAELPTQSHVD